MKKIFIHQANEKMDDAIVQAFYRLYDLEAPKDVMPMCVHWLGNSSVATIPTLFDLVSKGLENGHQLDRGDLILFASVGAGMNINAVCYRCKQMFLCHHSLTALSFPASEKGREA